MEYYSFIKKEWSSDIWCNTDKTWKHYAEWNKPDEKECVLCDSTYMNYLREAIK